MNCGRKPRTRRRARGTSTARTCPISGTSGTEPRTVGWGPSREAPPDAERARNPGAPRPAWGPRGRPPPAPERSEEHTSELQSRLHLVCRLLLEKKKKKRSRELVQQSIAISHRRNR